MPTFDSMSNILFSVSIHLNEIGLLVVDNKFLDCLFEMIENEIEFNMIFNSWFESNEACNFSKFKNKFSLESNDVCILNFVLFMFIWIFKFSFFN